MYAARKSLLLGLAALALVTGLSGCVVAERPGRYHGNYVAEGPSWQSNHWNNNGWQGNGGGNWNQSNHYH